MYTLIFKIFSALVLVVMAINNSHMAEKKHDGMGLLTTTRKGIKWSNKRQCLLVD